MTGERDPLERATRALREAPPPSAAELAAGRARMLAAHAEVTKRSRVRTLRWVLPLAAVLAAGSALAATPHGLERVAQAVGELFAPQTASKPRVAPKPTPKPPVAEPANAHPVLPHPMDPDPVVAAPAPAAVPHAAEAARAERPHRATRAAKHEPAQVAQPAQPEPTQEASPAVAAVEPAPELPGDRDLATYREAHRVHFRARDFASALRWWDSYLSEYPRGTFAVEARYNRAICLLRLGRRDEAKQALAPFARGEVARGYRQTEAKKLLEALE